MKLSIVVPTFRGGKSIRPLLVELTRVLDGETAVDGTASSGVDGAGVAGSGIGEYELIVVDDGSGPETRRELRSLAEAFSRVRLVFLERNGGQQIATMIGIRHARGERIVTMDDDLEHPPEVVPLLLDRVREGVDLVYAAPRSRSRSRFRNWGTRMNNLLFRTCFGLPSGVRVTSFRCIRGDLARDAVEREVPFHYLSVMLLLQTHRVGFVEYRAPRRTISASRYSAFRLVSLAFRLVLFLGPLRSLGRLVRKPRRLEWVVIPVSGACE